MCLSGAILGAGALGAGASIFGANQAAGAQTSAANKAIKAQMQALKMARGDLKPWRKDGEAAWENFLKQMPKLTKPFEITQEELEKTPGYQFTLGQGLKGVQNGYAAKGLASSGAALKGAAEYATGLADSTYSKRMAEYLGQNQQIYNMLQGPATMGQNAAAGSGNAATATGQGVASAYTNAGNAQAGMWGAIGNSLAGLAGTIPASMYMPGLIQSQINANNRGTTV